MHTSLRFQHGSIDCVLACYCPNSSVLWCVFLQMIHSLVVKGLIRRNAIQSRNFEFVPATDKKVGDSGSDDGTETEAASSNASGTVEEVPAAAAAASSTE